MQDLIDRLKDPEYAKLYGAEQAKVDFAITLAKARNSANLTQKGLSERLGISQPYIAKLEGGEANPTLGTIGSLLAVLGYRLVTQTAPLVPEPILPTIRFPATTDVSRDLEGTAVGILSGRGRYDWLVDIPTSKLLTTVGTANNVLPPKKEVIYAGGSV